MNNNFNTQTTHAWILINYTLNNLKFKFEK